MSLNATSSIEIIDSKERQAARIHFYFLAKGPHETTLDKLTIQFTTFATDEEGTAYEKALRYFEVSLLRVMKQYFQVRGIRDQASLIPYELKGFFVKNIHDGSIRPAPHIRRSLYLMNTLKKEMMRCQLLPLNVLFDYRCTSSSAQMQVEEVEYIPQNYTTIA